MLLQIEIAGYVKPEVKISFTPCAIRLCKVLCLQHALGIRKHQLEYVSSRLDVPSQGKRVVYRVDTI